MLEFIPDNLQNTGVLSETAQEQDFACVKSNTLISAAKNLSFSCGKPILTRK